MHHSLYIAEDSGFTPLAAVGIATGPGRLDTTTCKWALLLPHRPATPQLRELAGPPHAAEQLRTLALMQAVCHARSRQRFLLARHFRPAPWHTLQHWVVERAASREAVAAAAAHLGNREAFSWLPRGTTP